MRFSTDIGDGYGLALRTLDTAAEMHALILANRDRLRRWEPWAADEPTLEGIESFTRAQLADYLAGSLLPTALVAGGQLVGSATLRVDHYTGSAELGYWIDLAHQGRGIVTRACRALIAHANEIDVRRVEIRTATGNSRSIGVAERLGFEREGVLRSAFPIGDQRLDVAVYGLLLR